MKTYLIVGTIFELIGCLMIIFTNNYRVLVFVYTSFFSFGSGIIHLTCLQILWEHFLHHRGEIAGFVFFCSWMGGYGVTQLCTLIANAEEEEPKWNEEL